AGLGAHIQSLMDALNLMIETTAYAEFTGPHALNRRREFPRPQSERRDAGENVFLQRLFLFDSRQRLGVRFRISIGDADDYGRVVSALDPDGMNVGEAVAAHCRGFERELASTHSRVNVHPREPAPQPAPLIKIEEDVAV